MSTKYSVVIPAYGNTLDKCLKPCLESVIRNSDIRETEIIVVANGCDDATKAFVKSFGYPVRLFWFNEAIGFTRAANIGVQQCDGEYIVFLNSDVEILNWGGNGEWLRQLAQPFGDPKVAVTGPSKLFYSPIHKTTGARNGQTVGDWFILFFCAMTTQSIIKKIGMLDEVFNPGYGEDIDFCFRAKAKGYRCVQVPREEDEWSYSCSFPIYHQAGQSFAKDGDSLFPKHIEIITQRWNRGEYHVSPAAFQQYIK